MIEIKEEKLLISPEDFIPSSPNLDVIGTINPSAIRLPNDDILLYVRVIEKLKVDEDKKYYYAPRMNGKSKFKLTLDRFKKDSVQSKSSLDMVFKDWTKRLTFISHLRAVILDPTGFKIKSINQKPAFYGLSWDGELGIEDPRIVKIGNLYIMTYVTLEINSNISTSIAVSNDCKNWYRRGIIFEEQNKDVALFPELINKEYIALNRPEGSFEFSSPHIWMSYSKELENWGHPSPLILAKSGEWDHDKVGAGPPPIRTKDGWLLFYHGVKESNKLDNSVLGKIKRFFGKREKRISYNVGAALLDLKNPKKIIAKTKNPIITPRKDYERGTFENKNVVFPTGIVSDLDKRHVLLFSGGGDVVTSVKKIELKKVLDEMMRRVD